MVDKYTECKGITSADYEISDDDTIITGTSLGYGTELLIITPEMLKELMAQKIINVSVQGEYGLVIKLSQDSKEE